MKLKLHLLLLALCGTIMLQSCDDDDNPISVSAETRSAFSERFPSVGNAHWELKWNYQVAEFWEHGQEKEAWFTLSGDWCMTETDFGKSLNLLPAAVITAFEESQYRTWFVDDIDFYERLDKSFYRIQVETKGQRDRNLFFSPDGMLIKDVEERENDDIHPDTAI